MRVLIGDADEEVSPKSCASLVARSRDKGGDIEITTYKGATHSYDTPTESRQKVRANALAMADSKNRIVAFFDGVFAK